MLFLQILLVFGFSAIVFTSLLIFMSKLLEDTILSDEDIL